jgi:hypothetical protein
MKTASRRHAPETRAGSTDVSRHFAAIVAWLGGLSAAIALPVTVVNQSYPTLCAEEDNVTEVLLSRNATGYTLRALHPAYTYTVDNTAPNFANCQFGSDPVFTFPNPGVTPLFDNGLWVVVAETLPSFWLPTTMTVTVGTQTRPACHTFADNIFGSSVLLGPVTTTGLRPVALVSSVEFIPATEDVVITYADGSSTLLHVSQIDRTEFRLAAAISRPANTVDLPFAALRSMYVADGNSDVDTTTWTPEGGSSQQASVLAFTGGNDVDAVRFGRLHLSVHNTSAPDIEFSGFSGPATMAVSAPSFPRGLAYVREGALWASPDTPGTYAEVLLSDPALAPVANPGSPGHGLIYFDAPALPGPRNRIFRLWLTAPAHYEQMTSDPFGNSVDQRPAVSGVHHWLLMDTNRSGLFGDRVVNGHRQGPGVPASAATTGVARSWARSPSTPNHAYFLTNSDQLIERDVTNTAISPVMSRSLAGRGVAGVTRLDNALDPSSGHALILLSKAPGLLLYDVGTDTVSTLSTTGREAVFDPSNPSWIAYSDVPAGESDYEVFVSRINDGILDMTRRITFNGSDDRTPVWFVVPSTPPTLALNAMAPNWVELRWPVWAWNWVLQSSPNLANWSDETSSSSSAVYEINRTFTSSLPQRYFYRLRSP